MRNSGMGTPRPVLFPLMEVGGKNENNVALTLQARLSSVLVGALVGDALGTMARGTPVGFMSPTELRGPGSRLAEQVVRVAEALSRSPHSAASFANSVLPGKTPAEQVAASVVIGAHLSDDPGRRRTFISGATRKHGRGTSQAGRFVGEVVAQAFSAANGVNPRSLIQASLPELEDQDLRWAVERAIVLSEEKTTLQVAAEQLGNSAHLPELVALATFCFLRYQNPDEAILRAVSAGGAAHARAAIVCAWIGAVHGPSGIPQAFSNRLARGPFGIEYLAQLAMGLCGTGKTPELSNWDVFSHRVDVWVAGAVRTIVRPIVPETLTLPSAPRSRALSTVELLPVAGEGAPTVPSMRPPQARGRRSSGIQTSARVNQRSAV